MKRNAEVLSETFSPQAQKAYLDTLAESLSVPNKPRNPLRVDDVVRKNEVRRTGCVNVVCTQGNSVLQCLYSRNIVANRHTIGYNMRNIYTCL